MTQVASWREAAAALDAAIGGGTPDAVWVAAKRAAEAAATISETEPALKRDADILALRFVRGRMYHHAASAVYQAEDGVWRWRRAANLPFDPRFEKQERRGTAAYVERLEDEPVIAVMRRIDPLLRQLAS